MDSHTVKTYFGIQLTISIIAILLLFITDFGGYYYGTNLVEAWGYVGFGTGIISSVLIIIASTGFFLVILESYRVLNGKIGNKLVKSSAWKAVYGALIPLILTIPSALIIILTNLENDWWLDAAFYSTLIASLAIIILNALIIKAR